MMADSSSDHTSNTSELSGTSVCSTDLVRLISLNLTRIGLYSGVSRTLYLEQSIQQISEWLGEWQRQMRSCREVR